ncbi:IS4 family transposase (plasmid) [Embleya sp. NBC_00888]|uniref:IS4 family transposase n=1 Tax=Embleya sp. NBC_00888 TaxID=2975960 RepID=UPI00386B55F4|nr:IS4 family transposase [Embleya sp. NBC_00888]
MDQRSARTVDQGVALPEKCVISREVAVAPGVFAPGHLGELTQIVDFALVDAVLTETGRVQRRVRVLPSRVVVYFVLALALFEHVGYRSVWAKLVAGLEGLPVAYPTSGAFSRARRRVGVAPFKSLFEVLAGPVAWRNTPGAFWRGLRTVAMDGTTLQVPDAPANRMTFGKAKAKGGGENGYPFLRLLVLVETGTRVLLGVTFGPHAQGETTYAPTLFGHLRAGMLVLADRGFDSWELLSAISDRGADYLVRSRTARTPMILKRLPDGSYLSVFGNGRLPVRIVEATVVVRFADGSRRTEPWRLVTSLIDHRRYPAGELVTLYHERWEVETALYSIKCTLLGGRVLRSNLPQDIDQEIYALLTVYQALRIAMADAAATEPGLDPDRMSFTVALETACGQVIAAAGVLVTAAVDLVGVIGRALLREKPAPRRNRTNPRSKKRPTSKYAASAMGVPKTSRRYTLHADIGILSS